MSPSTYHNLLLLYLCIYIVFTGKTAPLQRFDHIGLGNGDSSRAQYHHHHTMAGNYTSVPADIEMLVSAAATSAMSGLRLAAGFRHIRATERT